MNKYLNYLKYLIKHNWYVMLECFSWGLFWQGLVHDWHKFLPCEFFAYANYFYGKNSKHWNYKPTNTGDSNFEKAWLHHTKLAKHHWQYWVIPELPEDKLLEIPDKYIIEMICDWEGAGKTNKRITSTKEWFKINKSKMKLNKKSESLIEWLL